MISPILAVFITLGGIFIGGIVGYVVRNILVKNKVQSAEGRAEKILIEAKKQEQELLLRANEKSLQIIEQSKKDEEIRRRETKESQIRLEQRETLFDKKILLTVYSHFN